MEFFDTKEEVIDIQLTQYGKQMLASGKFKPKFYSFSDDDVLYDVEYASGSVEASNNAHQRIKNQTIRTKAQTLFSGVETEIKRLSNPSFDNSLDNIREPLASSIDARKSFSSTLGNSDPLSKESPNYRIHFAKAPLSASAKTDPIMNIQSIPQLEVDYTLETKIGLIETTTLSAEIDAETATETDLNDYFFFEEEDFVFLEVKELNQLFQRENFDIEVFEYVTEQNLQGDTVDRLRPLKFMPTAGEESLKYATSTQLTNAYPELTDEYVEYFFSVHTDEEIDEDILCQVYFENKVQDIFADTLLQFECIEDEATGRRRSITVGVEGTTSGVIVDYDIEAPEDPC